MSVGGKEKTGISGSDGAVLITRGAGFVGSHLAEALLATGWRGRALDDLSTGSERNIAHLLEHPGFSSEIVHIPFEEAYGAGFEDLRRRVPDTRRVERLLGWRPRRALEDTLSTIIAEEREWAKVGSRGRVQGRQASLEPTGSRPEGVSG